MKKEMEKLRSSIGSNLTDSSKEALDSVQNAEDLIREIAVLEMEVACLEKHLLSMYRERFALAKSYETNKTGQQISMLFSEVSDEESNRTVQKLTTSKLDDSSILWCPSSLSQATCSFRTSSPPIAEEALDSYNHSQESPNSLSEEMIKCISNIYCNLANSSSFRTSSSSSPVVEIQGLCRDEQSLDRVDNMVQHFRYLVLQMEQIDPRKMKHDEKLAFWINVHNALVMHAFLVHGVTKSNLKRVSLLLKCAYNIGGKTVSVETIQSCILRCQLSRPGQWLQPLLFPKHRIKSKDPRREYAILHEEPRVRFALCSGCHSDPMVRCYTSKRVFEELEVAKEEYMQTNIRVDKEHNKLMIPKNVECFIKDVGLCSLLETFKSSQTDSEKLRKKIECVPHSFSFRFLISNELAEVEQSH